MKNKFYKLENENSEEITKLLKGLPKVNAPEDFEFVLMTKIKNKNFGEVKSDPAGSKYSWIFAPAIVVVSALLVLFFLIPAPNIEYENLLMSEPTLREDFAANIKAEKPSINFNESVVKNELKSKKDRNEKEMKDNMNFGSSKRINGGAVDVSREKSETLPYNDKDAIDLDFYLRQAKKSATLNNRAMVAGVRARQPNFDGFIIRIFDHRISELKAKMDSLINRAAKPSSVQ